MKLGNYRTQSEFKMMPAGSHVGVVTGIVFLGLQPGNPAFGGKDQYKLALQVSFPNEDTEDGSKNLSVTQIYTASTHQKSAFRKVIEAILGAPFKSDAEADGFDVTSLVGKSALFSVVHKQSGDKTFANVGGVIALPKGMPVPPVKNGTLVFTPELDPQEFLAAYNSLPEWLRKKWDERIPDENRAAGEDIAV